MACDKRALAVGLGDGCRRSRAVAPSDDRRVRVVNTAIGEAARHRHASTERDRRRADRQSRQYRQRMINHDGRRITRSLAVFRGSNSGDRVGSGQLAGRVADIDMRRREAAAAGHIDHRRSAACPVAPVDHHRLRVERIRVGDRPGEADAATLGDRRMVERQIRQNRRDGRNRHIADGRVVLRPPSR